VRDAFPPHLRITTEALTEAVDLLDVIPAAPALAWVRDGDGLVAWGEAARFEVTGQERFSRAHRWWSHMVDAATVSDAVRVPGSGPVAFGSFTFADGPGTSVLIVPSVVVGRRHGKSWITTVGTHERPRIGVTAAPTGPGWVREEADPDAAARWQDGISEAVARVTDGGLDKVVLARATVVRTEQAIDPRFVLHRLAADYPECWAFSVDGLLGATPELLVRRTGDAVVSRVLAGTVQRNGDSSTDGQLARALMRSNKDLAEHLYAVESVAAALARHCTDLQVPSSPSLLRLANVQHLATDVSGLLADDSSAIALAAALHPTAAVCGTPTERAAAVIAELEGLDRGRYAGPVGWVDANGDGEFGIALRCGEISDDATSIRLMAGCGIVAGSTPDGEWIESEAKLAAMRAALGVNHAAADK
jgi:menaquinone-specific isochorismate synthase